MRVRSWGKMSGRRLRRGVRPDKRGLRLAALAMLLSVAGLAQLAAAEPLQLQLPIACSPGADCFVQNYPDDDAATGAARDYACTRATYDGHDGTDIRVLSIEAAKGVKVLAAAAGRVRGMRDGVPDHLMRTAADKAALNGHECGNGVAIAHGDGWETQYCHMRQGSLRVHQGEPVAAGADLGDVGQSGETQFAHVHITVRHNGKPVDPFTGRPLGDAAATCAAASGVALWTPAVAAALGTPRTVVLETAFSDHAPSTEALEDGHASVAAPSASSQTLLLFGRIMHLRAGDRVHFRIAFPIGSALDQTSDPSPTDSAIRVFAGSRERSGALWPAGRYAGVVEVLRGDAVVAKGESVLEMTVAR